MSIAAPPSGAQTPAPTIVRVHVVDTSKAPIPGVSLVVTKDSGVAVLFTQTDEHGSAQFSFAADSGRYRLFIRKLGYLATQRAIRPNTGDTLDFPIELAPAPHALDTVRIYAEYTNPMKRPYIDSSEIAASHRTLMSLGDVFGKLRLDLDAASAYKCQPERLHGVSDRPVIPMPLGGRERPPRSAQLYVNGQLIPHEWNAWYLIRGQDVASARFVDCWDHSIPELPAQPWPAVYVVLKPGVVVERGRESHPYTGSTNR